MRTFVKFLYVFITAFAVSHAVYYYPQMPGRMAVNFGAGGAPNAWSSREGFFIVAGAILVVNLLVFAVFPRFMRRRKAAEIGSKVRGRRGALFRTDQYYDLVRDRLPLMGIANIVFGVVIMHLVYVANSSGGGNLRNDAFIAALMSYFTYLAFWLFTFFRKFQNVA